MIPQKKPLAPQDISKLAVGNTNAKNTREVSHALVSRESCLVVYLLSAIIFRWYFQKYEVFYHCYLKFTLNKLNSSYNLVQKPLVFKE